MNPTSKACPFCAETVPAAARICPRCRQWLSYRSLRHPVVSLFVVGLPAMLCFLGFGYVMLQFLAHYTNPPPYYFEHPGSIRVLESRINWVEAKDGSRIYVTGLITNQSLLPWKDLEFDCRFFNAEGVMIDACDGRSSFTIQPATESAFRVIVKPAQSATDYKTHRITVGTARNLKSAF